MDEFKIGERVIVKALSGADLPRRVAGFSEFGPLVCTEDEFNAATLEGREPDAIGWPVAYIAKAPALAGA